MRIVSIILVGVFGLGLISCDPNRLFEENKSCDDNIWRFDDIKVFKFENTDTISPLNLKINLRTTTDYPYSNIYMFMYSEYPSGESFKDTLQFKLAETDGKWLGENSGTVVEFSAIIGQGRFSKSGTYVFKFQHAMREENLAEIVDVGFRVELMEQ